MKVKELIKILADFHPETDVEIIYKNKSIRPTFDYGWDFDGTDISEDSFKHKYEAKKLFICALDEDQLKEYEYSLHEQIEQMQENCKSNIVNENTSYRQ